MSLLFAIASSVAYGVGDFLGGHAARRYAALDLILLAYPVSILLVLLCLPFLGGTPTLAATLWGAGSGAVMALAIWSLYAALARGPMGIVSSLTAVLAAGLPILFGLFLGENVATEGLIGMALAVLAIALVTQQTPHDATSGHAPPRRLTAPVLALTVCTGLAFALSFIVTDQIPAGAGGWPLLWARLAGCALIMLIRRPPRALLLRPERALLRYGAAIGCLDAVANAAMYYALQNGALSVTSAVVSLYPAYTIVLAVLVLKERMNRLQTVGLVCAAVAVVLISTSA